MARSVGAGRTDTGAVASTACHTAIEGPTATPVGAAARAGIPGTAANVAAAARAGTAGRSWPGRHD